MATDSLPGRGLPTDDPVSAPCSITPSAPPLESVQPVTVADTDPTGSAKRGLIEVPGYDILEEIGRGGMGVVYKAHQRRLNRIVALKMVLSGEHASAAELVRFLAEGEAVAQLHHPGIVQIHEIGQHNNLPYFCLEYVAGGSLNHLLRGRPQVPRQAATLVQSLACAVQHAHEHGIIHRDLKPANILLTADGSPRITDFGLAKRIAAGCGMTQTGAILGTPSYMAPEQAAGQGKEAGPATDVYALGAILYECLTGRPPFLAATPVDTMMQVVHQEPVPPMQLQPGLPRDLNTICLKCLRKEPARRYTTAAELADDLGRFLADRPILARPIGIAERGWRWCRRNPVVAAMTGSLALLLLVIAAGASLAAWRLDQERRTARANEDRALQSEEQAKRSEERAVGEERQKTERLWESLLDRARAGRFSHQAGQRFGGLQALARAARMRSDPALRDEAIALLALVDLRLASAGEGRTAGHPGAIEGGPTQLAAEGDAQGGLRIWRRWDGRELARLPGRRGPAVWHVTRFSPDGRFLAVWHSANTADAVRVVIWDWQARKVVLESNETVSGGALNWDPASRLLAVGRADGTIFLFDAKQGKVAGQLACGSVPDQLVFDSAGKRLAVSSAHQDDVRIFDLVSGQRLFRQEHPAGVRGVVFSPDGLLLATGCDDGNGYVWDLEKGRQQAILRGHQKSVIRLAFHPNGRLLASDGWDGHLWLWDPFDGRSLASTTGTLAGPFSADGRWLPARAGLYQVVGGEEWSSLYAAGGNRLSEVSFHRDGRLLAVSSVEGVRLWDVQQGRPAGFVPVGWCAALFDPAGDLITDGGRGLLRHPVRREAGTLVIDPPRSLAVPVRSQNVLMLAASGKGHLAVVDYGSWRGLLFPPGDKGPPIALAHPSTTCIDISRDGKHVATGSSYDETLKLWSETGQLLHTLKGGHMAPRFSPDGLHLAVCGDQELRLYQVSTWKQQWQRPRAEDAHLDVNGSVTAPAFSPNGRLLAYPHSPHQVRLVRAGDGELVATLESPDPRLIGALSFSPDGRLLAVGTDKGAQLWDLSALHRELKAIALDADLPAWRPTGRGDGKLVVRVQRTETPAVAEARKRRTATNEQIGGWVLQVQASDDGRARQALAEVGGPALPILARAARSSDIGRAALERLFAQISTDERLEPARVSLRLRDASVEKAVAALAAQVKTVLTLEAGVATELSLPPVTLEVENVSFWEALDRLCRTAGLAWTRAPGRGLILKRGAAVPAVSVAYAGASRLRISRLDLWSAHGLEGAGKGTSGLNLALQLHAEPHTRSVWLRRARIVEAREAAGSTLQDKGEANSPLFGPFPLGSSPVNLGVTLSAPRRSGGTLARLRVVVPFLVETQVKRLGTVSLAGAGSMSCIPLAHGGRLEILRVREVGQVVEIDVVQSEPAAAATDSYQRFEVLDDQGRFYRPLNSALTGAGQSPTRGQELLWLATPGVPWSALALHMRGQLGVQLRGTLRFERSAGLGRLHRLVLSRRIAQTRELTFEFRDVPLP